MGNCFGLESDNQSCASPPPPSSSCSSSESATEAPTDGAPALASTSSTASAAESPLSTSKLTSSVQQLWTQAGGSSSASAAEAPTDGGPALASTSSTASADESPSSTSGSTSSVQQGGNAFPPASSELGVLYEVGRELGRGRYGVIRECRERSTGLSFACKSIPKPSGSEEPDEALGAQQEARVLRVLAGHPHIVQLQRVVEDEAFVHLVLELCAGGELFDRLVQRGPFPERRAAPLLRTLMETLLFCHRQGIMHRDLKPENILLADASDGSPIKLADFGLALQFSPGGKFRGMAGSAYYMAPEVLEGREYDEMVDVWSAGVILYILISGVAPFWGETEQHIFESVREGKLDFSSDPLWKGISSDAKDLVTHMLSYDPEKRLTPAQVLDHPWIIQHTRFDNTHHSTSSQHSSNTSLNKPCARCSSHETDSRSNKLPSFTKTKFLSTISSVLDIKQLRDDQSSQARVYFEGCMEALMSGMDNKALTWFRRVGRRDGGWCTCSLLRSTALEEVLMVRLGRQFYMVVHDKPKMRIGWKLMVLKKKNAC